MRRSGDLLSSDAEPLPIKRELRIPDNPGFLGDHWHRARSTLLAVLYSKRCSWFACCSFVESIFSEHSTYAAHRSMQYNYRLPLGHHSAKGTRALATRMRKSSGIHALNKPGRNMRNTNNSPVVPHQKQTMHQGNLLPGVVVSVVLLNLRSIYMCCSIVFRLGTIL